MLGNVTSRHSGPGRCRARTPGAASACRCGRARPPPRCRRVAPDRGRHAVVELRPVPLRCRSFSGREARRRLGVDIEEEQPAHRSVALAEEDRAPVRRPIGGLDVAWDIDVDRLHRPAGRPDRRTQPAVAVDSDRERRAVRHPWHRAVQRDRSPSRRRAIALPFGRSSRPSARRWRCGLLIFRDHGGEGEGLLVPRRGMAIADAEEPLTVLEPDHRGDDLVAHADLVAR